MAVCSPPPGLMVISNLLDVHQPNATPGPEWVAVRCASKVAYGCGELGERLLYGLNLLVRRVGHLNLNSCLSIDMSYEALWSIQAELGVPEHMRGLEGDVPEIRGVVLVAKAQVLVSLLNFRLDNLERRAYYLVYDATDASLYMIPRISNTLEATYTMAPVPVRPAGSGRGHELALAAETYLPQLDGTDDGRLCVCTPATRAASLSSAAAAAAPDDDSATTGLTPWEIKVHEGSEKLPHIMLDAMFSLGNKVFWGDLSKGVAYSDLRQGGPAVDAVFIALPDGYQIDLWRLPKKKGVDIEPMKATRTMGCVQGSIKFVCIERGKDHEMVIKVWTLDLERQRWKEDDDLTCPWKELWMQACTMNARLRNVQPLEPKYPVLMPDGALCLLLPRTRHRRMDAMVKRPDFICSFDMLSKSCLCFGYVRNFHAINPLVLPSDFFKDCYPAPPKRTSPTLKRRPPVLKRKLPSINKQDLLMSVPAVAQ